MAGLRIDGEPGTGWKTATSAQKDAWLKRIAAKCFQTGHFKSRPSSPCPVCGHTFIRVDQDQYDCDRENGWDWCT